MVYPESNPKSTKDGEKGKLDRNALGTAGILKTGQKLPATILARGLGLKIFLLFLFLIFKMVKHLYLYSCWCTAGSLI